MDYLAEITMIILARQKEFPLVRGIRTKPIIADGPNGSVKGKPRSLQDPEWRNGLALLEKYDLSWDLRVPWYHLEEAAEVVRDTVAEAENVLRALQP